MHVNIMHSIISEFIFIFNPGINCIKKYVPNKQLQTIFLTRILYELGGFAGGLLCEQSLSGGSSMQRSRRWLHVRVPGRPQWTGLQPGATHGKPLWCYCDAVVVVVDGTRSWRTYALCHRDFHLCNDTTTPLKVDALNSADYYAFCMFCTNTRVHFDMCHRIVVHKMRAMRRHCARIVRVVSSMFVLYV